MGNNQQYITQEEARKQLGVTRSTLYYYMKALRIKGQKFDLDRHVYLLRSDFERIKEAKKNAQDRVKPDEQISKDDSLDEVA